MTQILYVQLELMLCRYKSAAQDASLNIVLEHPVIQSSYSSKFSLVPCEYTQMKIHFFNGHQRFHRFIQVTDCLEKL